MSVTFQRAIAGLDSSGSDANYVRDFTNETSPFVVIHSLGKIPEVSVVDTNGQEMEVVVDIDDAGDVNNKVTLKWDGGGTLSGKIICN